MIDSYDAVTGSRRPPWACLAAAMRILITGAAGFIGSHIAEAALACRARSPRPRFAGTRGARRRAGLLAPWRGADHRGHPGPIGGQPRPAGRAGGLSSGRHGRSRGEPRRPARIQRCQHHRHRRAARADGPPAGIPPGTGLLDGGVRRGRLPVRGARPGPAARPRPSRPGTGQVRGPLPVVRC